MCTRACTACVCDSNSRVHPLPLCTRPCVLLQVGAVHDFRSVVRPARVHRGRGPVRGPAPGHAAEGVVAALHGLHVRAVCRLLLRRAATARVPAQRRVGRPGRQGPRHDLHELLQRPVHHRLRDVQPDGGVPGAWVCQCGARVASIASIASIASVATCSKCASECREKRGDHCCIGCRSECCSECRSDSMCVSFPTGIYGNEAKDAAEVQGSVVDHLLRRVLHLWTSGVRALAVAW